MIKMFQIVSVLLAALAVYFLLNDNLDYTFVVGALAAASFLLSIRFQIKSRISERSVERDGS